jgi:hypothetical protein
MNGLRQLFVLSSVTSGLRREAGALDGMLAGLPVALLRGWVLAK